MGAHQMSSGTFKVHMNFDSGGLTFAGTRNCTICCNANSNDFDFSVDGNTWHDGTAAEVVKMTNRNAVEVTVAMSSAPKIARYTANNIFPQCAIYNKDGLPAFPFQLRLLNVQEISMHTVVI